MIDKEKVSLRVRLMIRTAIRIHRRNAGLSADQLANRIGVTRNTIINYELGHTNPTVIDIAMIALAIGCRIDDLIPTGDSIIMAERISDYLGFGE